VSTVFIYDSVT